MTDPNPRSFFRRHAGTFRLALAALLASLGLAGPATAAIDPDDLLPVDEAFALTVEATSPDRIALHWRIADGYYLYRHRIGVQADAGFAAQALQLPKGETHEDEFFGKVETYRQSLTAILPGQARAQSVTLKIKYQGCADAGICYPPQTRNVTVALPGAAASEQMVAFGAPGAASPGGLLGNANPAGATDALPLPPEQAFRFEAIASDGNTLLLRFTPTRGYYLYRDKTSLKLDAAATRAGISLGAPRWPRGVAHRDEHFGNVVVFFDEIEVPVPLGRTRADATPLRLTATFQGCQNEGICYPPMTRSIDIALPAGLVQAPPAATAPEPAQRLPSSTEAASAGGATASPQAATGTSAPTSAAPPAATGSELAEDSRLAAALSGPNRWWALASFFGFGLLLAFTPCVLPMIPILSGLIAGHGPGLGARRAFALSFVYVLANALVFTVAGVIAGLVGANLQAAFQTPWVLVAFALLFIALALSSFGLYELQLPAALRNRLGSLTDRQRGGSWVGVAVMGALSALIVGPCVAPPLAAAVLYISQSQDPAFGGAALFLLAMGMGVPLLVFGVAAGKGLPTNGPWMVAVQRVFGFVFLGLAVWMLSRILPAPATLALWGALLLAAAAAVVLALKPVRRDGARVLGWTAALLLGLLGTAQLVGAMAGSRDPLQPLAGLSGPGSQARELPFRKIKSLADLDREVAAAQAAGKPLLLDFYADWCVSCKEMEKYTFPQAVVHDALSGFVLLKADVTANDELDQALMKRLGIIGPPATLYYTGGSERRELRLFGFEESDKFVQRAQRASR
ncbi:thiol:disulfide interchange protein DsbD [Lysobacter niastensis]|uniref:Thiol:disulfide interchange protein DsbD n=1 Tax=Lysobacter niastensis TaxID=380629 RepID=A0ABU1W7D6_9GAMM|nr:protein-disulfide reductase DsbD [Lysobacter niastensis]MDR7133496.1 thiol:disulfide interchange protein DsbD [Lysobacter niastensis]